MSFRQPPALGFFIIDDLLVAASAIKGATSLVSNASTLFDPGASTDQKRLARANFFRDSALEGSITAARYLLGGLNNVASHEKPYYTGAWAALVGDPTGAGEEIAAEANAQGALWNANDVAGDANKSAMIADVQKDLKELGKLSPSGTPTGTTLTTTGTTTGAGAMLPGMRTTASYNWVPYAIAGGLGLGAVALITHGGGRRRRRR